MNRYEELAWIFFVLTGIFTISSLIVAWRMNIFGDSSKLLAIFAWIFLMVSLMCKYKSEEKESRG